MVSRIPNPESRIFTIFLKIRMNLMQNNHNMVLKYKKIHILQLEIRELME